MTWRGSSTWRSFSLWEIRFVCGVGNKLDETLRSLSIYYEFAGPFFITKLAPLDLLGGRVFEVYLSTDKWPNSENACKAEMSLIELVSTIIFSSQNSLEKRFVPEIISGAHMQESDFNDSIK